MSTAWMMSMSDTQSLEALLLASNFTENYFLLKSLANVDFLANWKVWKHFTMHSIHAWIDRIFEDVLTVLNKMLWGFFVSVTFAKFLWCKPVARVHGFEYLPPECAMCTSDGLDIYVPLISWHVPLVNEFRSIYMDILFSKRDEKFQQGSCQV